MCVIDVCGVPASTFLSLTISLTLYLCCAESKRAAISSRKDIWGGLMKCIGSEAREKQNKGDCINSNIRSN
jgi:hypothetical protein